MPPASKPTPPNPASGPSGEIQVIGLVLAEIRALRQEQSDHGDQVMRSLGAIDQRLSDGDKRLDDHSERIDNVEALIRKSNGAPTPSTEKTKKGNKVPWYVIAAATGALTLVGDRFAKFIINGLADPPVASVSSPKP